MFTYKLVSPEGVAVEYTSIKKSAKELVEGHAMIVKYFEKLGWRVIRYQ